MAGRAELYMGQGKNLQTIANAVVHGLLASVFITGIAIVTRMARRNVFRLGSAHVDTVDYPEAYAPKDAKENSVYAQQSIVKGDADRLDQHNHLDQNGSTDKVGKTHEIMSDKFEYIWSMARALMNKAAHIINGNGPRTVSTTWAWDSDDSQHWSDAMLGSPMSPLPSASQTLVAREEGHMAARSAVWPSHRWRRSGPLSSRLTCVARSLRYTRCRA